MAVRVYAISALVLVMVVAVLILHGITGQWIGW